VADELDALAERPDWTVTAGVAAYEPEPGAWLARIRAVRVPGRTGDRWDIAIVDPTGMARYATTASTVPEATGSPRATSAAATSRSHQQRTEATRTRPPPRQGRDLRPLIWGVTEPPGLVQTRFR
jgi:hypothetical protein